MNFKIIKAKIIKKKATQKTILLFTRVEKKKHKVRIQNNKDYLNSIKGKKSSEWRE